MPKSLSACCVVGCSNCYQNTEGKGIIFYSFPGRPYEKDRREKWISSIRRINEDGTPWQPTKFSRVCSEHFISKKKNGHPAHPDYVPSVFPDCYKKRKADGTERFCRLKKRKKLNFEDAGPEENLPEIEAFELPVVHERFEEKCVQVHFEESEWESHRADGWKKLKPNAVPTIFNAPNPPKKLIPTTKSHYKVCEKRFETQEVEWSSSMRDPKTGKVVTAPLYRPGLKQGAVPSIFPEVPVGLHVSGSVSSQEDAEDRMADLEEDLEMSVDERICRICGLEASNLTSLFETQAIEMGLLRKIEDILSIKIEIVDDLPNQICGACISNLDSCEQFIKMARKANLRLHKIYGERKELLKEAAELIKCPYCDKEFRNRLELNRHVSIHSTAALYLCDLCGSVFKNANGLECHKRNHLDESARKKHPCTQCDKKFRSRFELLEHENSHSGSRPYSCSVCGKTFERRLQLRQHSVMHATRRHICSKCGKAFARHADLRLHLRRHEVERTFDCSVCYLSFATIGALLSHRKQHQRLTNQADPEAGSSVQNSAKPGSGEDYNCVDCGKLFSNCTSLLRHSKAVHGDVRDFCCEQCDKRFKSQRAKLIHQRTHTGLRPFQCSMCEKTFMSSNVLNQHMKDHLETPRFECAQCNKKFKRIGSLNVHLSIHSGQRPFPCDLCGRSFLQKNDMLKHVKRMHSDPTTNNPNFSCENCSSTFNDVNELNDHKVIHETAAVFFPETDEANLIFIDEI